MEKQEQPRLLHSSSISTAGYAIGQYSCAPQVFVEALPATSRGVHHPNGVKLGQSPLKSHLIGRKSVGRVTSLLDHPNVRPRGPRGLKSSRVSPVVPVAMLSRSVRALRAGAAQLSARPAAASTTAGFHSSRAAGSSFVQVLGAEIHQSLFVSFLGR